MEEILAKHTGRPVEWIQQDTDRDYDMAPEQPQAYGVIDAVCSRITKLAPPSPNGGALR
jgi:ATP-dependent Clp protease, protease subunit